MAMIFKTPDLMTREKLMTLVTAADNPELPSRPGGAHVQQIWSDGELTSTKGGELLGQRTLHQFEPPVASATNWALEFPHRSRAGTYAWVSWRDGLIIRAAIMELVGVSPEASSAWLRANAGGKAGPDDRLPYAEPG